MNLCLGVIDGCWLKSPLASGPAQLVGQQMILVKTLPGHQTIMSDDL